MLIRLDTPKAPEWLVEWVALRSRSSWNRAEYGEFSSSSHGEVLLWVSDIHAEALYKRGLVFSFSLEAEPRHNRVWMRNTRERIFLQEERPRETVWIRFTKEHIIINAPDELDLSEEEDHERWLTAGISCRPGEWPVGNRGSSGLPWAENPFILKWWTPAHDALIQDAISRGRWLWSPPMKEIIAITPPAQFEEFKKVDPRCKAWVWSTVLQHFVGARADIEGFTARVRMEPKWVRCLLCDRHCHQSRAYRLAFAEFCTPCVKEHLFSPPCERSRRQILEYLCGLTEILQRIPPQDFGRYVVNFTGLSSEQVRRSLPLFKIRPSLECVQSEFGGWFQALVKADILPGAHRTGRGTHCIAADGHLCLSLGEKTLCDLFAYLGIPHEREVRYPGNRAFRADWAIGEHLIEYFGLTGDPDYDAKSDEKCRVATAFGKTLIKIYPEDLVDTPKLIEKLRAVIPLSAQQLLTTF